MGATATPDKPAPLTAEVADLARQIDALPAEHRAVLVAAIEIEVLRLRMRRGRVVRTGKRG